MPRTRDQRCQRVINLFFNRQLPNTHFQLSKVDGRGWKIARYKVIISSSWFIRSPSYDHETRTLVWNNIEHNQELPDEEKIQHIVDEFSDHFKDFEKKERNILLSFLCLHETEIEESKVTFNLIVQYDKDHIPFPENDNENMEARIEQLERNNEQLLDRLRLFRSETERYVGPMRRRLHRVLRERDEANMFISTCENVFKMNNSKYMECYRNILRDCYKTMNKTHECPICYENIEYMNVFTTPCNHVMCNECSTKCKNVCPMCRQEMAYFPEEQEEEMEF